MNSPAMVDVVFLGGCIEIWSHVELNSSMRLNVRLSHRLDDVSSASPVGVFFILHVMLVDPSMFCNCEHDHPRVDCRFRIFFCM